jgi:chitin synthase
VTAASPWRSDSWRIPFLFHYSQSPRPLPPDDFHNLCRAGIFHSLITNLMDGARPPRSVRPGRSQQQQQRQSQSRSPAPPYTEPQTHQHSPLTRNDAPRGYVSFQHTESGDRNGALDAPRERTMSSPYQNQLSPSFDSEAAEFLDPGRVGRKKSLVKPDRERIEPGHRQWHYRAHATQAVEGNEGVDLLPSCMCPASKLQQWC